MRYMLRTTILTSWGMKTNRVHESDWLREMFTSITALFATPYHVLIRGDGHRETLWSICPNSVHRAVVDLEGNTTHPKAVRHW